MIYYHCRKCGKDMPDDSETTNYNEHGVLTHWGPGTTCDGVVEERDTADLVRRPNAMMQRARTDELAILDAVARLNLGAQLLGGAVASLRSRPQMAKLAMRLKVTDLEEIKENASRIADEITRYLIDEEEQ